MDGRTTKKIFGLVLSIVCVLAISPAQAGPAACRAERPQPPWDASESDRVEIAGQGVMRLTDAATERRPFRLVVNHEPSVFGGPELYPGIGDSSEHLLLQVVTKRIRGVELNAKLTWPVPTASDISLWAYDVSGRFMAGSDTPELPLGGELYNERLGTTGGPGLEMIEVPIARCAVATVSSFAFVSPGETVTLELWLEPLGD